MEDKEKPSILEVASSFGDPLSVHLGYIRRDIDEIKGNQRKNNEDIKEQFKELKDGYIPRQEYMEHIKEASEFKERLATVETKTSDVGIIRKLVYGCCGLILSAVVVALIYLVVHHA